MVDATHLHGIWLTVEPKIQNTQRKTIHTHHCETWVRGSVFDATRNRLTPKKGIVSALDVEFVRCTGKMRALVDTPKRDAEERGSGMTMTVCFYQIAISITSTRNQNKTHLQISKSPKQYDAIRTLVRGTPEPGGGKVFCRVYAHYYAQGSNR